MEDTSVRDKQADR